MIHIIITLPCCCDTFPKKTFTNEEATVAINEAVIVANKGARNPNYCFFVSCFTVSVTPSIKPSEISSDFIIHIFIRNE